MSDDKLTQDQTSASGAAQKDQARRWRDRPGRYALLLETLAIIARSSDFQSLLKDSIKSIRSILSFERATLALINPDKHSYKIQMLFEKRKDVQAFTDNNIPIERGLPGKLFRSDDLFLFLDTESEESNLIISDHAMENGSLTTVLGIVLQAHDKKLGVITIGTNESNAYTGEDVEIAVMFATHLALAVDRWQQIGHLEQLTNELSEENAERRLAEQKLKRLAHFDVLTGLHNRVAMQEILDREHARATRQDRPYSILMFDLDHFKLINDTYGHGKGDYVLKVISKLAKQELRDGDCVGRWGGEEFLCVLPEADTEEATRIAERLRRRVADTPIEIDDYQIDISISIGISSYPKNGSTPGVLMTSSDIAMYEAKRSGRNRIATGFDAAHGVLSIAGQLEHALQSGRLQTAYQPIVDLQTEEIIAEEALARIVCDDGKLMEAGGFIESAIQMQLVHRIDDQIIRQAIERCVKKLLSNNPTPHFVNISADFLRHPKLINELLQYIEEQCESCKGLIGNEKPLIIEITEQEFFGNTKEAREALKPFLDIGFLLAIDDFGSGYSSYKYLADLPVKFIKIEGELVKRVAIEGRVRSIIRGIQETAAGLGITTLAEHVENRETADVLREIGINLAQGYYYGLPRID